MAHRPSGIPPVLHTTFDGLIKNYFDTYRAQGSMPPEIAGKVEGELLSDQALLNRWRNWRSGLSYEDKETGAALQGALDDCVVAEDGSYMALDYKTKGGKILKDNAHVWYQHQLDIYTLFLQANGYKINNTAYLVFFNAVDLKEGVTATFAVTPRKIATNPEAAKKLLRNAVALLQSPMPARHSACSYCSWGLEIADLD